MKKLFRQISAEPLTFRLFVVFSLVVLLLGVVTFWVVGDAQRKLIEYKAITIAEVVARHAAASRTVYAREVAAKLKQDGYGPHIDYKQRPGFAPLPAQFLKLVGREASDRSADLYAYKPISRWNLEETQGLADDFQRWAWKNLEAQDQAQPTGPIDWKPVWRFDDIKGIKTLRYLRADPADGSSCVECHNRYEASPDIKARRGAAGEVDSKNWKLHQLLGAIEVSVPVHQVEALALSQSRYIFALVVMVLTLGLGIAAVFVFHDYYEKRRMSRSLAWQAKHDSLTGLYNRYEFERRLQEIVDDKNVGSRVHALMYIDLDQFKVVNDTCGHAAGDELLRQLVSVLKAKIRREDVMSRIGGDEFTVLLYDCSIECAKGIANSLRDAANDFRFVWDSKGFGSTISIGLVQVNASTGESVARLLGAADEACYAAKEKGRNAVHVYHEGDRAVQTRHRQMQWVEKINRSLDEGLFRLYVQRIAPIGPHPADTGMCEVLLRMKQDNDTLIPPRAFIPAAERYNLMPAIDRWVVQTVFDQLSAKALLENHNKYFINLSGISLNNDEFIEFLAQKVSDHPDFAQNTCFEITETTAIASLRNTSWRIERLRSTGCSFALDDFGSGMSSFTYLRHLPIDYLKIDGIFIRSIVNDKVDRSFVESMNDIGHLVGIKTIAEQVESTDVLEQLKYLGVDYAQGFLIDKPAPLVMHVNTEVASKSIDLKLLQIAI